MNDRFYKLFEVMLNKGIYLAPNAYEVGFVSLAHDHKIQEELNTPKGVDAFNNQDENTNNRQGN
jgi:glutamate-1-semialdehyde aminotransferase